MGFVTAIIGYLGREKKSNQTQETEMKSNQAQETEIKSGFNSKLDQISERRVDIAWASRYTGYSISYIYKLTSGRKIPFSKPHNGKLFFKISDLDEFLSQNTRLADFQVRDLADSCLAEKPKRIARKARR